MHCSSWRISLIIIAIFAVGSLPTNVIAASPVSGATASATSTTAPADLLPAEDAFKVTARFKDAKTIELNYQIADGYYLYRKRFRLGNQNTETAQFKIGKIISPRGLVKQDATFGRVETYRHSVRILLPIAIASNASRIELDAATVKLNMISQGCADVGVCYPPLQHDLALKLGSGDIVMPAPMLGANAANAASAANAANASFTPAPMPSNSPVPAVPGIADLVKKAP